ncbi:adenylate/guanylate cyclase domain-containing protein [Adhaeribacter radiodurans]|uniref:Adenylate cyclase n=1 Tax=Adhaeribacter radiodurans TaxID=2745197 RepID=A0A7L7L2X0_9BACT|nr:adenylate/guanylate cyclase domain-containing protein [Adhaeribacter radiodurans]QMU27103.1 tetratricopeptide repeat protein [Adhaeribacter radiodurans]
MKKMFLLLTVFVFASLTSLCQDPVVQLLKTALQKAKEDTTRLRLHLALARAGKEQEKLFHSETAIQLTNKLLKRTTDKNKRRPIVLQEIQAYQRLDSLLTENGKMNPDLTLNHTQRLLELHTEIADKKGMAEQQWRLAYYKLYKNDTTSFLSYMQLSLVNDRQAKDTAGIVSTYRDLASFYLSIGNFPKALGALQTGLATAKKMNYKKGMAWCHLQLADIYRDNKEATQALQNYQTALPILYALKDTASLYNGLAALGGFYYKQNNIPKTIETYHKVIALGEAKKDLKQRVPGVYKWMGQVYKDAKDYTQSVHYYEKSLEGYKKQKNLPNTRLSIAYVLGGLGEVYQAKRDFAKATDYYLQAAKIVAELKDEYGLASAYWGVARARLQQKNHASAKQYSHQALQLLRKQYALEPISQAERLASQVDSASGNGLEALQHYQEYVRLTNQLRGDEIRKAAQVEKFDAEFAQQKALAKAEQEKREAVTKAQLQEEQTKRYALYGGLGLLTIFAGFMFNRFRVTQRQKRIIEKQKAIVETEKRRSDDLLLNILPAEVAEELKEKGHTEAKLFEQVTVMFTDFKGFTQTAEKLSPKELVAEIDTCFSAFDHIISQYNIEKIKTIGDSYMCVGGLPVANRTNAMDVLKAALEIQYYMQQQFEERTKEGKEAFEIRIGIHTGPVVAGIVGVKKFAYDVWGDTVNIASRMESSGEAGHVNISGETYEVVKDAFVCLYRGKILAKNKGEVDMYFVEGISLDKTTHLIADGLTKVGLTGMNGTKQV